MAQGVANILSGTFGGMDGCAVGQTMIGIKRPDPHLDVLRHAIEAKYAVLERLRIDRSARRISRLIPRDDS